MYNKILVPIDLSHDELISHLIPHIKSIAQTEKTTEIHFITAIPDYSFAQGFEFNHEQGELFDDEIRKATAIKDLENKSSKFNIINGDVFFHVGIGAPRDIIIDISEKINPDIIIISSRNPSFSSKYLLGSTADAVVRYSKFPVLVVR